MTRAQVGITLQPEAAYLELLDQVFAEEADYFELAPETLWRRDAAGEVVPNGFRRRLLAIGERTGRPFVAHAVGASLGTADPDDRPRQQQWLSRLGLDHEVFRFQWCTDHLGAGVLDGRTVTLPIALPMTPDAAALVRRRLVEMQQHVADTGFENSVFYFLLGDWLDEPAFFDAVLTAPRTHLLLDLHNVHTMAHNLGTDPGDYLMRIDTSRVIEIHLSGGRDSEVGWLPDGQVLRLDSHDTAVPEAVWQLFETVLPRCRNLRGVTLERMEGTIGPGDVDDVRRELRRAREVLRGR